MATFRSVKNVTLQGDDGPVVVGEFDYNTRDYVYTLSADDAAAYGPALVREGAVEVAETESVAPAPEVIAAEVEDE